MGLAAMIIGIVAVVLGFIPFCGYFALIPAIVGLVLGIVDVKRKSKTQEPSGKGKAGIVLNAAAIIVILVWTLIIAVAAPTLRESVEKVIEDANITVVVYIGIRDVAV